MMRSLLTFLISYLVTTSAYTAEESYIVVERYSRRVLLAEGSEMKRPVSSLAHMVTAKVAMDWAEVSGTSSSAQLIVPQHQFLSARENPLSLQPGDSLSMRDALYASLLTDDCVATTTLATYVGRDLMQRRNLTGHPIGVFVTEMNNLARALGMTRTHFAVPFGADSLEDNSYSTASDIARLSVRLSTDSGFGFYVKQSSRKLTVLKYGGSVSELVLNNNNRLLTQNLKIAGLKAGFSPLAGGCAAQLVDKDFYVEKEPGGGTKVTPVQLIVVVLGSQRVDAFAQALIPQGWSSYDGWRQSGYLTESSRKKFLKLPERAPAQQ